MRKKKYCIVLSATLVLGQTIILNPSQVYSASVSRVSSEELVDNSAKNSITKESNAGGVLITPDNPQPITPTVPPIVPETPDITLPPVTIVEPVPITPTVPVIPSHPLPVDPVPITPTVPTNPLPSEPVTSTPTVRPNVPQQPDISLPPISPTAPETAESQKPESDTEKKQHLKKITTEAVEQQVTENKDTTTQVPAKEEPPQLPYTWEEATLPVMSQQTPTNSLNDAGKDAAARKHAIAVHAAGTGGVVTGIGTSVLLLGILKKVSWLRQFFVK
ncbi:hypothetical protein [Lactococcus garvieae]|uniref:hypothetical protein n=1 Tax=Lactococcus garvieae TaxID=1363 RepID=UPI00288DFE4C|nr:hypothetical protein [Lactococcus garvieae]MDT2741054.1 hypothetical protein [Lactococcus garvieae]